MNLVSRDAKETDSTIVGKMVFEGLSGFPITPLKNGEVDLNVLCSIRDHIDCAGLDSIGVLGSTGSFAYLSDIQRISVMECWGKATTSWIAGVSATTTKEAIKYSKIAEKNGAQGIIANAFAYVPLSSEELKSYFLDIADASSLPLCVYDNPLTTGQTLSDELIRDLSQHENIKAIKVFAKQNNVEQHSRLSILDILPGYAVDANCCEAMISGGSTWYSTLAGTLPELLVPVMNAIKAGEHANARQLNNEVKPLYELMKQYSGFRVMHALANQRGWTCELPKPLSIHELGDLSRFLPN
jgi:4-hydroxy-tetrahydrodipicolinate synthase